MNPLFQQYGNANPMMAKFKEFQRTFKGDPQKIVQEMLNSGRISQEQFNRAAQIANELMRSMK